MTVGRGAGGAQAGRRRAAEGRRRGAAPGARTADTAPRGLTQHPARPRCASYDAHPEAILGEGAALAQVTHPPRLRGAGVSIFGGAGQAGRMRTVSRHQRPAPASARIRARVSVSSHHSQRSGVPGVSGVPADQHGIIADTAPGQPGVSGVPPRRLPRLAGAPDRGAARRGREAWAPASGKASPRAGARRGRGPGRGRGRGPRGPWRVSAQTDHPHPGPSPRIPHPASFSAPERSRSKNRAPRGEGPRRGGLVELGLGLGLGRGVHDTPVVCKQPDQGPGARARRETG